MGPLEHFSIKRQFDNNDIFSLWCIWVCVLFDL